MNCDEISFNNAMQWSIEKTCLITGTEVFICLHTENTFCFTLGNIQVLVERYHTVKGDHFGRPTDISHIIGATTWTEGKIAHVAHAA